MYTIVKNIAVFTAKSLKVPVYIYTLEELGFVLIMHDTYYFVYNTNEPLDTFKNIRYNMVNEDIFLNGDIINDPLWIDISDLSEEYLKPHSDNLSSAISSIIQRMPLYISNTAFLTYIPLYVEMYITYIRDRNLDIILSP